MPMLSLILSSGSHVFESPDLWQTGIDAASRDRAPRIQRTMELDGVAGEVLYPSQGLFYFKVADTPLMSAIFRAYNDWLAEFCRRDAARLKGIAMINLDDVQDEIKELERAARLGLSGTMITEYPLGHRRSDQSEYEPFWG
jgi:hypothetical protein